MILAGRNALLIIILTLQLVGLQLLGRGGHCTQHQQDENCKLGHLSLFFFTLLIVPHCSTGQLLLLTDESNWLQSSIVVLCDWHNLYTHWYTRCWSGNGVPRTGSTSLQRINLSRTNNVDKLTQLRRKQSPYIMNRVDAGRHTDADGAVLIIRGTQSTGHC